MKMGRTNFYETLHKKAFECTSSGDLIQQTNKYNKIQQTTLPKVVIKSSLKLFFYPLFIKDSSE